MLKKLVFSELSVEFPDNYLLLHVTPGLMCSFGVVYGNVKIFVVFEGLSHQKQHKPKRHKKEAVKPSYTKAKH